MTHMRLIFLPQPSNGDYSIIIHNHCRCLQKFNNHISSKTFRTVIIFDFFSDIFNVEFQTFACQTQERKSDLSINIYVTGSAIKHHTKVMDLMDNKQHRLFKKFSLFLIKQYALCRPISTIRQICTLNIFHANKKFTELVS